METEYHLSCNPQAPRSGFQQAYNNAGFESDCPCPKASCGLIIASTRHPRCHLHGIDPMTKEVGKSIKHVHRADECPGPYIDRRDRVPFHLRGLNPDEDRVPRIGE